MSRMNFEHLIALVEECHRFRDLPFERVSLAALCGDDRLIDEYIAVLLRAVRENGMQRRPLRAQYARHGTGRGGPAALDASLPAVRAGDAGRHAAGRRLRKDRAVNRQKMDYAYFTALMEECHRFMERPFTRVPEQELAGNRALLLQYTDVLHSVFERYGTKRDGGMTALGFEIYEALSIVTRYRERLFGDDREQTWG